MHRPSTMATKHTDRTELLVANAPTRLLGTMPTTVASGL